jgi:UDP-MurNAc hydroxylase
VQVTSVGHAGIRIDTKAGSILCDPWVSPARFASWFPFPDSSALDWDALGDVDYLCIHRTCTATTSTRRTCEHVNKDAELCCPTTRCPTCSAH